MLINKYITTYIYIKQNQHFYIYTLIISNIYITFYSIKQVENVLTILEHTSVLELKYTSNILKKILNNTYILIYYMILYKKVDNVKIKRNTFIKYILIDYIWLYKTRLIQSNIHIVSVSNTFNIIKLTTYLNDLLIPSHNILNQEITESSYLELQLYTDIYEYVAEHTTKYIHMLDELNKEVLLYKIYSFHWEMSKYSNYLKKKKNTIFKLFDYKISIEYYLFFLKINNLNGYKYTNSPVLNTTPSKYYLKPEHNNLNLFDSKKILIKNEKKSFFMYLYNHLNSEQTNLIYKKYKTNIFILNIPTSINIPNALRWAQPINITNLFKDELTKYF